jgi:hypothetical protein
MKELIKKYLLDVLIITGVLILSYNILRPETILPLPSLVYRSHHIEEKVFGIFLISIGVDMAIRKCLSFKYERKN